MSTGGEKSGEGTLPARESGRDFFYTPSEAARLLQVPLRSVLKWLEAGEVEAELDSLNGRWKIPKASLKGFGAVGQKEEELVWRYERSACWLSCTRSESELIGNATGRIANATGLTGSKSKQRGCAGSLRSRG